MEDPDAVFLLGYSDGELVGTATLRLLPYAGYLQGASVTPEARGQGVVEELYSALNQLGKQQGWPFIRWITAENNYRGRAVYDKLSDKTHWMTYQMQVE